MEEAGTVAVEEEEEAMAEAMEVAVRGVAMATTRACADHSSAPGMMTTAGAGPQLRRLICDLQYYILAHKLRQPCRMCKTDVLMAVAVYWAQAPRALDHVRRRRWRLD